MSIIGEFNLLYLKMEASLNSTNEINTINTRLRKHPYTLIIGNIYTSSNEKWGFLESILIKDNKIVVSGSVEKSHEYLENNQISLDKLNTIKLKRNELVLPGFIDSHVHPFLGAFSSAGANLSECESIESISETVKTYIEKNETKDWIYGFGYNDAPFMEERLRVNYKTLDLICSDKPIILLRYDAHAYWVNSYVLKLAGINKETISPEGGVIEHDESDEVTGIFHDNAMSLIKNLMPRISKEAKVEVLKESLKYLLSQGITAFMDAAVKFDNHDIYKAIYSDVENINSLPRCALSITLGKLFVDVEKDEESDNSSKNLIANVKILDNFFSEKRIKDWDIYNFKNKFKVNTVKLFIDGVFESGTAMFTKRECNCSKIEDYNIEKSDIKCYTYNREELEYIVNYLYKNDIQLHAHCIGDTATTMIIDALENAISTSNNVIHSQKNYLAHLQLVNPLDIKRMKNLGIHANFTPQWFMEDQFSSKFELMIGEGNKDNIYPIKSMLENKIKVCFGSDWPVSTINPLEGIERAITHRGLGITPDKPSYIPDQQISIHEAIKAYTLGSAEVLGLGDITGSLEIGKEADLIILDKNIFEIDPWEIHTASVTFTMVGGISVYDIHNIN